MSTGMLVPKATRSSIRTRTLAAAPVAAGLLLSTAVLAADWVRVGTRAVMVLFGLR